jgi:Protein of unknown function (DUF1549)/Protein of unknown function (DUF1553)
MQAACITRHGWILALGVTCLLPAASRAVEVKLPGDVSLPNVDFERHIMGLFGRAGCASGSCHGSFQGKGGFRLSLFGYDPQKDFQTLTHDAQGRRINVSDPDSSLLLLKATGQVKHEGQTRFTMDSWQYRVFRAWIAGGATWRKGSGEVQSIKVQPNEYAFDRPGQTGQLVIQATFADGTTENITSFCDFRTNDDTIVDVASLGQVKARREGDTAIIVSYRGHVLPVRVLVPTELPPGFVYPKIPEINAVDREVFAKLRRLNMVPSELSGDGEFLRRVTIDTLGTLPTPEEYRAFLADSRPDKRAHKIEELLAHPMHAALWATKFCDITGNNTDALEQPQPLKPKLSQMWHDWFRKRMTENMAYDEIVRGVLCSTSREGQTPEEWLKQTKAIEEAALKGFATTYADRASLDLFWRRQQPLPADQWGQKTAAAFLGVRLECAECHKHPFDRWTQADYRAYANLFTVVKFGVSPEGKDVIAAENTERLKNGGKNPRVLPVVREIFVGLPAGKGGLLTNPDTNQPLTPKALGGPEIKLIPGQDPRVALFDWMRAPENPFFARGFVNRVWGHYFGVGIVSPVDDFSLANPPSNDRLLDTLARDFVQNKFDIRRLERLILQSRTYQLTAVPNATNRLDRTNYSHSYIRPMLAEVVVDVLNTALGTKETFGPEAPAGCRAIEIGASRLQNQSVAYAFRIFGRPPRTSSCDCQRAMEPGLPQKLFLMADPNLQRKLTDPNNRIKDLLARHKDDNAALDEIMIAMLSRLPTDKERSSFAAYRAKRKDRRTAFNELLWVLVNTTEFIFNH